MYKTFLGVSAIVLAFFLGYFSTSVLPIFSTPVSASNNQGGEQGRKVEVSEAKILSPTIKTGVSTDLVITMKNSDRQKHLIKTTINTGEGGVNYIAFRTGKAATLQSANSISYEFQMEEYDLVRQQAIAIVSQLPPGIASATVKVFITISVDGLDLNENRVLTVTVTE